MHPKMVKTRKEKGGEAELPQKGQLASFADRSWEGEAYQTRTAYLLEKARCRYKNQKIRLQWKPKKCLAEILLDTREWLQRGFITTKSTCWSPYGCKWNTRQAGVLALENRLRVAPWSVIPLPPLAWPWALGPVLACRKAKQLPFFVLWL